MCLKQQKTPLALIFGDENKMRSKTFKGTFQKWKNSLAISIPSSLARSGQLDLGISVKLTIQNGKIIAKQIAKPMLTLEERLDAFDPKKHGGEFMISFYTVME